MADVLSSSERVQAAAGGGAASKWPAEPLSGSGRGHRHRGSSSPVSGTVALFGFAVLCVLMFSSRGGVWV